MKLVFKKCRFFPKLCSWKLSFAPLITFCYDIYLVIFVYEYRLPLVNPSDFLVVE